MKKIILTAMVVINLSAYNSSMCDAEKSNANEYYSNARAYYSTGELDKMKYQVRMLKSVTEDGLDDCRTDRYKLLEWNQWAKQVLLELKKIGN